MSKQTPEWIEAWLSKRRFQKYLNAAGGDPTRGLALYEWNSKLSSCLIRDLGHLEVGIRNAYDRALLQLPRLEGRDWITEVGALTVWSPEMVKARKPPHRRVDKNKPSRDKIELARKHASYTETNDVHRDKVVAELTFGFWTYQTDRFHEKSLWLPVLRHVYPPGADRAKIHTALTALRDVRNRLAHHESVFDQSPENIRRRINFVARQVSPEMHQHIESNSAVQDCLRNKP